MDVARNGGFSQSSNLLVSLKFTSSSRPTKGTSLGENASFDVWIVKIGQPWRPVGEANLDDAIKLPDPENPTFGTNSSLLSLKMPELLSFEVAIGRNANFQILGKKGGKCQNSSSRPPKRAPKGTSLRENASFDV